MKRRLQTILPLVLFGLFFLLDVSVSLAAGPPGPPGGGGGGAPCWPPPCQVPIDGGIGFLMAAGVLYGGKKIYDKYK